ncbi:diacylglycerol kinase family protein [Desulforamulus aquiferis]|uniref:diacylglycerol kinase family protein n=1 Tax=Desulforamulus aquiferis TaxID=1397668 RepID=UPI002714B5BC|nr:diacylglycerol kinase family protein [Desulforamulus aquiferis]
MNSKGILSSFGYALRGIIYVIGTQRNMKVHLTAALLVVTVGLFLHLTSIEWLSICSAIFLVLIAESLNTAIEAAVDLATSERHPLAGIAKDCAAGAVLLAAIYSLVVAYLVFWPKISSIFFG